MLKKILAALAVFVVLALCLAGCTLKQRRAMAPAIQYTPLIAWQEYEAGMARAAAEHKPVLLTFGADWCEPCKVMARVVFEDPRVVAAAKDFVVIHVNAEKREDIAKKYDVHGYPTTFFLTADGAKMTGFLAPWRCSPTSYDAEDPASLLWGMAAALKRAADPAAMLPEMPRVSSTHVAQLCALGSSHDDACDACVKAHCCAEFVACMNDAAACLCNKAPRGAARDSLTACIKGHCPTQCPKLLKPPTDGASP